MVVAASPASKRAPSRSKPCGHIAQQRTGADCADCTRMHHRPQLHNSTCGQLLRSQKHSREKKILLTQKCSESEQYLQLISTKNKNNIEQYLILNREKPDTTHLPFGIFSTLKKYQKLGRNQYLVLQQFSIILPNYHYIPSCQNIHSSIMS